MLALRYVPQATVICSNTLDPVLISPCPGLYQATVCSLTAQLQVLQEV